MGAALSAGPRILLIDDDPQDRGLASVVISRELPESRILEIDSAKGFATALAGRGVDLIVTEQQLSWSDGLSVLEAVHDSHPEVPVIVFTHVKDEELAVAGMKAGLADFLIKSSKNYLRLATAVREAIDRATTDRLVARSEPWLQTLLDRANVGVFRSTPDQRLIEANPALLRLLGVDSVEEALRVDLPIHYFRAETRADLMQQLNTAGELQARVVEFERPDGSTVWLNLTEVMLLDVDGDIVVDVLVQNVGHLKEHEGRLVARLKELERSNSDLVEFASVASHELQEPLRMVEKFTQILDEELPGELSEEAETAAGFVLDGTRRMRDLVEDLLQFARASAGDRRFTACDLGEIADRAIRSLQSAVDESEAEIRRDELPKVLGDPSDLEQVFRNLIANAVKFRGKQPPRVRIGAQRGEDEWILSVSDNGIGIEPKDAEAIFTIFKRLHPEYSGTGIGLAICKRIVERQGGRIWVDSAPGKGSTFYFSVPLGGEPAAPRPRDRSASKSKGKAR